MINRLYIEGNIKGFRGFAPRRGGGERPRSGLKTGGDFPLIKSHNRKLIPPYFPMCCIFFKLLSGKKIMNTHCFKVALRTTIPVFLGYISCGIAFGLVTVNAGYSWWLAPAMGILMYAGAGQFLAIPLFAAGTPVLAILATELLLNIRHIVYGLPLINQFNVCKRTKPYLIFALTDETFSLLTTTQVPAGVKAEEYYFMVSLLDQIYWVGGSLIGGLVGAIIPFDMTGVDFALTALFAVLTIDQIQKFVKERKGDNDDDN